MKEEILESSTIRPEYEQTSLLPSEKTQDKQRQLLILDLNGTLCSRSTLKSFTVRPHAKTFFNYIFDNFTVMVWSSAQMLSVKNMCQMFKPFKPQFVWDRSHLGLSATAFHTNVDTVKDLEKVWRKLSDFGPTNTIVLDDSVSKLALQPYNLIKMSTFDLVDFELQKEGERDLLKALKYLKQLQFQTNVSNYIRVHPFIVELNHGIAANEIKDRTLLKFVNGVLLPNAINVKKSAKKIPPKKKITQKINQRKETKMVMQEISPNPLLKLYYCKFHPQSKKN